jgi:endonuclease-3 related protein
MNSFRSIYPRLLKQHGPQGWWPADTPFEVMVGAVLTQNTAWANVERAIGRLKDADCLSAAAIVRCSAARLADLIRPSGYFNVKAGRLQQFCAWYQATGELARLRYWPTARLRTALLAIKGVGPETADDILLYAFNRPVFVIDAYTRRLFGRLGLIGGNERYEMIREQFERALSPDARLFKEYHALIVIHGKNVCRTRPRCDICSLASRCPASRAGKTYAGSEALPARESRERMG